ncbi:MAG: hypothetical protein M3442_17980 [Chloroflexota bacterium]|nr:hypothetical protein [Chloroflexota bacterium]
MPRALLLVCLALPLLRLATYSAWADGALDPYRQLLTFGVAAAGVTWGIVRLMTDGRSLLPWVAAVGVLLPGDALHYTRLGHPIARLREYVLADDFGSAASGSAPAIGRWLPELQEGATAAVIDGRLQVRTPPDTRGFVGLRLAAGVDPALNLFWLPRGAFSPPRGEVLEWEGAVQRLNRQAIMLETRTARFEVTSYGLRVTYLLLDGRLDGADVEDAAVGEGRTQRFRLERTDGHPLQRLLIEGREVWARPKPVGEWEFARFGATRTGDEHGGTLVVDNVRYRRLYGAA